MNYIKWIFYILIFLVILWIIYEFKVYILWFINAVNITFKNKKGIKDIQKEGINIRNLSNEEILKYIKISKDILNKLCININKKYVLNKELERHLIYSRFSEKYVLELLKDILIYLNLNPNDIHLKINYISSKYYMSYAGSYSEKENVYNKRDIVINIQNDMTIYTVISIIAHECTHHLLLSKDIRLKDRLQNECLTDIITILLGFGKYMIEGYKISNKIIYDEINHRSIKKNRVGYLSCKDIEYVMKNIKNY